VGAHTATAHAAAHTAAAPATTTVMTLRESAARKDGIQLKNLAFQ
jgi:hypothetical protein